METAALTAAVAIAAALATPEFAIWSERELLSLTVVEESTSGGDF